MKVFLDTYCNFHMDFSLFPSRLMNLQVLVMQPLFNYTYIHNYAYIHIHRFLMPNCLWYKYSTRNKMQLAVIDTFMNIREDQVNIKFMAET